MHELKIYFINENKTIFVQEGISLLKAQILAGIQPDAPCGGRGTCGKCMVKIRHSAEDVWRRVHACRYLIWEDLEVCTLQASESAQILTHFDQKLAGSFNPPIQWIPLEISLNRPGESVADWELLKRALTQATGQSSWQCNLSLASSLGEKLHESAGKLLALVDEDYVLEVCTEAHTAYALAFDIGTTSIVGYLLRMDRPEVAAQEGVLNPQRQYGADIIIRADYALENGVEVLAQCVREAVDSMAGRLCEAANIRREQVYALSIVGNTCMHHLFLGLTPSSLVRTPYNPAVSEALILRARDCGISVHPEARLRLPPVIAGFVGSDTVGCMIAEAWDNIECMTLLIDIGTNGEIVLGNRHRMIACSTAAGPAFEGAKIGHGMRGMRGAIDCVKLVDGKIVWHVIGEEAPIGICGSGLIDLVAVLRCTNVINAYGELNCGSEYRLPGTDLSLTQRDVREIQLAKAAICAGIYLLSSQMGISLDQIDQVHIAGAFGNYMDPGSACKIGLIPMELRPKIRSIGNAAGEGAKLVLQDRCAWERAKKLAQQAEFLELASLPTFQDAFVDALEFPELKG